MLPNPHIFLTCSCHIELLEIKNDPEENTFEIAMWSYGRYVPKPPLWLRLKGAFTFLIKGSLYTDQVIIGVEEARRLRDFLKDNT